MIFTRYGGEVQVVHSINEETAEMSATVFYPEDGTHAKHTLSLYDLRAEDGLTEIQSLVEAMRGDA